MNDNDLESEFSQLSHEEAINLIHQLKAYQAELLIANKELAYQNEEKIKRAAELIIANKELAYQNKEKASRAAELIIANKELAYQNKEKAKRAAELNAEIANALKLTHELEVHQIELKLSNDELIWTKEQSEVAAQKYAGLYDFAPTGYFTLSSDGTILGVNISGAKMLGRERAYLVKTRYVFFVSIDTTQVFNLFLEKAFRSKATESCEITITSSGNQPVFVHLTGIVTEKGDQCLVNMFDITASKQAALYKEIHHEILEILNEQEALHDTIPRLINILQIRCGFDAVGIRLQDGDDFPYFAQNGFSTDFLCTENTLVSRSKEGELSYDKNGHVSLECFCGLVISGNPDPVNQLFTVWGSVWTNDSFPFLRIPSDEDPRLHPRNLCIYHGYASMALIPIKNTSRNIGLIQFNSRRKDFFNPDMIENLEGIARHIGEVLMRKKAEDELQESERQYRILVETSPEGILIAQGANLRFVNQPMVEITGYSVEELLTMPIMDLVYHDDRELVENNYLKRLKGDPVDSRYHFRILKRDGCLAWVEINCSKTEWKGEPAVINFVCDITERKQAEAVRHELEAKHSSMISHISEVIGIIGADGFMKYKSPNIEKWFGWQPQDLVGTDGWLTVHPDDLQRIQKEFYSLIEDDSLVKKVIYRYKCKDGSYKPIELTASNHLNDPVINGILLNYRDITERKKAEERLNQLTTRLQLATHAGGVGVWDYDMVNNILIWDDQMFALYGINKKNFSGAYDAWLAGVHPDDVTRGDLEIQMALDGEREFNTQFRVVWPDGTIRTIRALAIVDRDKSGNPVRMIGTNWDITSFRRTQEEIRLKNAELQKLNTEKDKFFSIIAHDLRSPFQTLLGFTPEMPELLLTYPLEKIQRLAINMRTSANKLYSLLENLLEWSQMQRGNISFNPEPILLPDAISEIVALIRDTAEKKMIEINCHIPDNLTVMADKRMFESLVRNLVFNAVKFTHNEGKVFITAKANLNDTVEISVRDTGIGMNKDMLDKLFQLDANGGRKGTDGEPSTGLGLFICKDFAEKHNGKLWAESEEGKGSNFRFTLPANAIDLSVN